VESDGGHPRALSSSFVNRIVKKCARRAGLRWREVHTHTLRHTAAMLRRELGGDLQELQEFLNHSSLAITQIYVQHTEKRTDTMWAQVEALIGVE
jgi:integrase/recombinase XerD